MLEVSNIVVSGLVESVLASGYAMMTKPYDKPLSEYTEDSEEFKRGLVRMKKLVHSSKETDVHCHDNALTGVTVSFDIKYPHYWALEAQRYHFLQIVTSSSKMHRLLKMDIDNACNKYVSESTKALLKKFISEYNDVCNNVDVTEDQKYEAWMKVLSNTPLGLELFMRVSTNYKQLQTIYFQRRHHKLIEDWQEGFCQNFIEKLPYSKELIIGE